MNLIDTAFDKAKEVLRRNMTERGFSACSMTHDEDPRSNYRSVWARDSALTLMWSLPLRDPELDECGRRSLETILSAQSSDGHLPNYVDVASGKAVYGGIGNIAGIDGAMWVVIAFWQYIKFTRDYDFGRKYFKKLFRTMRWLRALDSNNCGLLEIPEASDWTDLFPRSYNVLYDEVLWYRANVNFVELLRLNKQPVDQYVNRAARIRHLIIQQFWPTPDTVRETVESFAETQFTLGRTRYLISQITPFGFSWRCDVYANIIASLYGVLDEDRSDQLFRFLHGISVDRPYPVRVLYPVIRPGESDWRDYFLVNLQNLPHHYHNGGIWPFVGGLWVRFLTRIGKNRLAQEALESLAELNRQGFDQEWEFNEWAHGDTGRPMGKAFQAWSAASYVAAYLRVQGDASLSVAEKIPDEVVQAMKEGIPRDVAMGQVDMDQVVVQQLEGIGIVESKIPPRKETIPQDPPMR